MLAAYTDEDVEVVQSGELVEGWARDWGIYMAKYLPVMPGSRLARGLGPLQDPPIMKFLVPVPDDLLFDRDMPASSADAPTLRLPGTGTRCIEVPATLDDLLETEEEERAMRRQQEDGLLQESLREEARVALDTAYLRTLDPERGRKRPMMVVELSSSSTSQARVARCIRIPVNELGTATLKLRMWRDDEEDQDDIETVPAHQPVGPQPAVPTCEGPQVSQDSGQEADEMVTNGTLADLGFDEYSRIYEQWVAGVMSASQVIREFGRNTLDLMQNQWAVEGDVSQADDVARASSFGSHGGVQGHLSSDERMGVPYVPSYPALPGAPARAAGV